MMSHNAIPYCYSLTELNLPRVINNSDLPPQNNAACVLIMIYVLLFLKYFQYNNHIIVPVAVK